MRKYILGSRAFEREKLMQASAAGNEVILVRSLDTKVLALEGEAGKRSLDFAISTQSINRYGDTVANDGWRLDNFRKNPVVLWAHDNSMLPIGKASDIRVDGSALKSRITFTTAGDIRFNDNVFNMLRDGFLSAVSVGFVPIKFSYSKDKNRPFGIDILEQELLEISVVTVPANPNTLVEELEDADSAVGNGAPSACFSAEFARRRIACLRQYAG